MASSRDNLFSYILGFLTAIFIASLLWAAVILHPQQFRWLLPRSETVRKSDQKLAAPPSQVMAELARLGAVFENAPNFRSQKKHDTVMVQPDPVFEYRVRPNVALDGYVLKSRVPFDLDPPVLHVPQGQLLSDDLRGYISHNVRLAFAYRTDAEGHRVTLPQVRSPRKILFVGDSVAFGVGVSDEHSVPSQFQSLVGDSFQVMNKAVGGYDGQQAFRMAQKASESAEFDLLVYIACQNDFMAKGGDWISPAQEVVKSFQAIADRFQELIIVLTTFVEYNERDLLVTFGWPPAYIEKTQALREQLPLMAKSSGLGFLDWSALYEQYRTQTATIFGGLGLYTDHCHLSPEGARLAAVHLLQLVQSRERLKF